MSFIKKITKKYRIKAVKINTDKDYEWYTTLELWKEGDKVMGWFGTRYGGVDISEAFKNKDTSWLDKATSEKEAVEVELFMDVDIDPSEGTVYDINKIILKHGAYEGGKYTVHGDIDISKMANIKMKDGKTTVGEIYYDEISEDFAQTQMEEDEFRKGAHDDYLYRRSAGK